MVSNDVVLPKMRWMKPNVKGMKPSARYFHAMTVLGDAIVVIGGKDDHNRFTDVHVFNKDLRSSQWTQPSLKGACPKPRSAHTINVVGSRIFIFGGHRDREKFNDIHILDTTSMSWMHPKVKGIVPMKRNAHTTTTVGTSLYVFGGFNGESCNDLHIFDTEELEWKQPTTEGTPPPPRCCHTSTNIDGTIWVFAGKNNDSSGVIDRHNDVHSFNTKTSVWHNHTRQCKGIPPSKRNAHTTTVYKHYLLIFGGFDGDSCNDLFLFDTVALMWHEISSISVAPTARYCHAAASFESDDGSWTMLMYGGCDSDHNYSDVQLLEIMEPSANQQKSQANTQRMEELEDRLKQLEEEKNRLNRIVDAQHETITRLKDEKVQIYESLAQQKDHGSSDDDDSENPKRKKKKKKKKDKKKKHDDTASGDAGLGEMGPFDDDANQQGTGNAGNSSFRQQPRPPAHLTPLNLQKVSRPSETGLPNTCPTRQEGAMKPGNALFPPLKAS